MNEYIFNGKKNHRTRRAVRPLTLALIQQNIYKGKYRPSDLTHTVVKNKKKTFNSSMQLTYIYKISS